MANEDNSEVPITDEEEPETILEFVEFIVYWSFILAFGLAILYSTVIDYAPKTHITPTHSQVWHTSN